MVYKWHIEEYELLLRRKERLPHALLFCGREGIGKLAFAKAVARALLCERPQRGGEPCGRCVACVWMEQGSHPDFRRLDPEIAAEPGELELESERKSSLQISVGQVRGIAGFINVSSHRGGRKVVLIHPAETLNISAANALLKNLEEPPPGNHFLLVAHRRHQLLPTIRSRCERLDLPTPDLGTARSWLEQQKLPDADLALAQAGGAPMLALEFNEEYWRQRDTLLQAITASELDALRAAEQLRASTPALIVSMLQKWSFDLVWQKVTGRVRFNPDHSAAIAAVAQRLDLLAALRFQRRIVGLQRIATHPLNARLFFEQLLLSYAQLLRGQDAA